MLPRTRGCTILVYNWAIAVITDRWRAKEKESWIHRKAGNACSFS
ncbi:helix-turn-helix domain-containing protein [Microcoleus sp. bin38.metabat.b11b12b14.051]